MQFGMELAGLTWLEIDSPMAAVTVAGPAMQSTSFSSLCNRTMPVFITAIQRTENTKLKAYLPNTIRKAMGLVPVKAS